MSAVARLRGGHLSPGRCAADREREAHARFDIMVLVEASEAVQLDRLMAQRRLSRDEAMQRIRSRMPWEEKRRHAHFVIENGGPLEETERQVRTVWGQLQVRSS